VGRIASEKLGIDGDSGDVRSGKLSLSGALINALPQAADADVIRSMQVLPGVQSANEQSNSLYIRGGTPDQNLILLDNTEVYNPSHLGGIFSTFNSDAISSVELYKAGFPCRYGDRLSSVIDIRNKDGNRRHQEGVLRLSMMSASSTVQGPWEFSGTSGSYMASFRRTLYELLDFDIPDSYFYDGHLKLNWDAGLRDKLFFSTYFGEDHLYMNEGEEMDMTWGNQTVTAQWQHIFSSRLYGKLNLSSSGFYFDLDQVFDGEASVEQENEIADYSLKINFYHQSNLGHQMEYGLELKSLDITFGADTNLDIDTSHYPWLEVPSRLASLYLQDKWKLNNRWILMPGLRYTWCTTKSEYHPSDSRENYHRLSPRIALKYNIAESTAITLNYGRYYQYLTAANRPDWPMSLWMPIDKSVAPGEADHYVLGLEASPGNQFSLQIEGYYKALRNQISLDEAAFMEWDTASFLSEAYKIGDGYSYGLEFLVNTGWRGIEGFMSYTYSKTRLKIDGSNINPATGEAEYYHPSYDRTHNFNVTQNYFLSRYTGYSIMGAELILGMLYSYGSGQAGQSPEGVYEDMYGLQFVSGYLDNARLPDYSRLDLSIKFKWDFGHYELEPYIMVVNCLDNRNIWTRRWYAEADNDAVVLNHRDTYMFERMPFLGINISWR